MNDSLPPWRVESVANIWNEYSRPLKLRQFSHGKGGSAARSAKRLTAILLNNAHLLEMGKHRDLEDLCDAFEATLQVALVAMQKDGIESFQQRFGEHYRISVGFWVFCRDLKAITTVANEALGRTPEVQAADQQRRRDKAAAIKAFKLDVDIFIEQAVRLSGDNQGKLDAALNAAKHGLMLAEDYLR